MRNEQFIGGGQANRAALFSAFACCYAELGWALVKLSGKVPTQTRWQEVKPMRPDFVAGQWAEWGGRGFDLGVVLGSSGLVVVEPDTDEAKAQLLELVGGELPLVPIVVSGGKSLHLYFRDSGQVNATVDGLELRSGGQQVVAPPSVHPETARPYRWLDGHEPWTVSLGPIPARLLDHFARRQPRRRSAPLAEEIYEPGRHTALVSLAGSLRGRGLGASEIAAALLKVNELRCRPPLEDAEVIDLAIDVARRYRPDARRLELEQEGGSGFTADLEADAGEVKPKNLKWETPVPLSRRPPVPSFPLEMLPAWLHDWALETAREKGASVDLAVTLALGAVAGALARHVQVSPRPGWYEPLNLYVITALEPGQRKSPVFKAAFRPVRTLEQKRIEEWEEQNTLVDLSGEILAKRRKGLIAKAADEDELDPEQLHAQIAELLEGLGETEAPPRPRLLTEDVTPEGLAQLLAEHGRIVAASDEGAAIFENFAGRYTHGSTSWDVFNKAHSAADLVVDRKSSGPVIVWDPALTLVIATQPKMLRELWGKPGVEGRGVLARPLYALPKPAYTTGRTTAASPNVVAEFDARIRALFDDVPLLALDEDERPQPVTLTLANDAEAEFERYEDELAQQRRALGTSDDADDEAAYLGWLSKLAGQTARLAACLHAGKFWASGVTTKKTIDRETVAAAVGLARYFHAHALVVFGLMGELPEQRRANTILGWLRSRSNDELASLTVRDVHRSRKAGTTAAHVRAALTLLEAHGYLRLEHRPPGKQGGRPSERIYVSPALRDSSDTTDKTDKTDKTVVGDPQTGRSVSSVGRVEGPSDMRAPLEHADPNCRETRSWRARDGNWRCSTCTPPAFPDEIVEEQP